MNKSRNSVDEYVTMNSMLQYVIAMSSILLFIEAVRVHQHFTNYRTQALQPGGIQPKLDRDRTVRKTGKYLVALNM